MRAAIDAARLIKRTATRLGLRALHRADHKRWRSEDGLEIWWEDRTRAISELVPSNASIIEFGAGRRRLERYLPDDCVYTPSDLVDRGPGTIVFDLNERPLPDLRDRHFDTAVFAGVLEYVADVESLGHWLSEQGIRRCLASFDPVPPDLDLAAGLRERARRVYYGYHNALTEADLLRIFQDAGFRCVRTLRWTTQRIYAFEK